MPEAASQSRVIPVFEYRRERWRNGLGWTREIHAQAAGVAAASMDGEGAGSTDDVRPSTPPQSPSGPQTEHDSAVSPWLWRLSIAEIESDAAFSTFPGVDRELVLLSGKGMCLKFDDGRTERLDPPYGRLRFAGERGVVGELVDGRTHDFNLMWKRDAIDADLWHRSLVGPMVFFAEPGVTWALHLIVGDARFDNDAALPNMASGDTALLCEPWRKRFLLDGGGDLLAIRLRTIG